MKTYYQEDQKLMKPYKKETILSPSNFYLVNNGLEIIKLRKGMSQIEVIKLLGVPHTTKEGNHPNNQKLLFKLTGGSLKNIWYSVMFRENMLEWSTKINGKLINI